MSVRILIGDCRVKLAELESESVDVVIADPPYGQTSLPWDRTVRGWADEVARVLKPSGSMWVFGSLRFFMEMARLGEFSRWQMSHDVVWEKHNGTGLFNDRFRTVHEHVAHFYRADSPWAAVYKCPQVTNDARARVVRKKPRPKHWIGATGETIYRSEDGGPRMMRSVLFARSEHGRAEHPTQKPLSLVEPLLLYACPPMGRVLDPFAGSGTVGVLARRHGFRCTLIEANPEYAAMAERRISGDAPLFADARLAPPSDLSSRSTNGGTNKTESQEAS